jgi:hypothetical protein
MKYGYFDDDAGEYVITRLEGNMAGIIMTFLVNI